MPVIRVPITDPSRLAWAGGVDTLASWCLYQDEPELNGVKVTPSRKAPLMPQAERIASSFVHMF